MKYTITAQQIFITFAISFSSLSAIQIIYPNSTQPLNKQNVEQLQVGSVYGDSTTTASQPSLGVYQAVTGKTVETKRILVPTIPRIITNDGYSAEPTAEERKTLEKETQEKEKEEMRILEEQAEEFIAKKNEGKKTHNLGEEAKKELDSGIKNSKDKEKRKIKESKFNLFT